MNPIIVEGTFVNHDETFEGQVEIDRESGLIGRLGRDEVLGEPTFTFDKNHLIFPGMVDVHIHAREDDTGEQTHKETYQTANNSAINGGVVAVAPMPNTPHPLTTSERLAWHNEQHRGLPITFLNYAGVGPDTSPISENVPYKVYTGPSVGDIFFESEAQLREALQRYVGKPLSFHVEDYDVLMASSERGTHTQRRPVECVETALRYVLEMVEEFKIPAKLCHWSTGGASFDMIKKHRERNAEAGLPYTTIEVSPLHLIFDEDMLRRAPEKWPYVQMNPALQSAEHRQALIEGLRTGFIDYIATDHAPHTLDEKFKNFADVGKELGLTPEEAYLHLRRTDLAECQRRSCLNGTSGTPQLDTYGLVAAWLIGEQGFSPQDVARVTAYNPGVFTNQFVDGKFGKIAEMYQGSLTVLDMGSSTTLDREMLKTKVGWSPFEGMVFPGRVAMTMIRGEAYKRD